MKERVSTPCSTAVTSKITLGCCLKWTRLFSRIGRVFAENGLVRYILRKLKEWRVRQRSRGGTKSTRLRLQALVFLPSWNI